MKRIGQLTPGGMAASVYSEYGRGVRLPGQTAMLIERERLCALEEEKKRVPPRYCRDCPEQLNVFRLNRTTMVFVCDNFGCTSWRNPQGYHIMKQGPTDEQVEINEQLDGKVCEEDDMEDMRLEKLRNKLILRDKRNPRAQDK